MAITDELPWVFKWVGAGTMLLINQGLLIWVDITNQTWQCYIWLFGPVVVYSRATMAGWPKVQIGDVQITCPCPVNCFGWWFGTCFIFPYIGNFIIPTDEVIFFRGVGIPPARFRFLHLKTWDLSSSRNNCLIFAALEKVRPRGFFLGMDLVTSPDFFLVKNHFTSTMRWVKHVLYMFHRNRTN